MRDGRGVQLIAKIGLTVDTCHRQLVEVSGVLRHGRLHGSLCVSFLPHVACRWCACVHAYVCVVFRKPNVQWSLL